MVLISELQKEEVTQWWIFTTEQLLPFIGCTQVKLWVSRKPVCVFMSLWLSGRVMMETVSIFSFWSCSLHIVIHTVHGIPLLVWRENRHQSPIASYNQFMSFFHLWRVFIHFLRFSQLEFSDSGFCSTLCRRGKWDLGRSEDLFIMETPVCYLLPPQISKVETEVRASSAERYCCVSEVDAWGV